MKYFKIAFLIVLLCWTSLITAEDEGSKRNLLLRRPNPRGGPLSKTTTTTTTAAPKQDGDEIGDEEYDQTEDLDEAEKEHHDETAVSTTTTTTTTEPPKKIGPIIRPFRSNDDLLLALKRRQMNIKKGTKIEKPTPKPEVESEKQDVPTAPQKSTTNEKSNSRRRFGGAQKPSASEVEDPSNGEEQATSVKRPSRFSLRTSRSN